MAAPNDAQRNVCQYLGDATRGAATGVADKFGPLDAGMYVLYANVADIRWKQGPETLETAITPTTGNPVIVGMEFHVTGADTGYIHFIAAGDDGTIEAIPAT